MRPHIPTMLMMLVAAFLVMSLGIAFFARTHHRALRTTALGLLIHSVGYALFSLRGQIPNSLSIIGGNVSVATACALYLLALYRFQERPPHRWLLILPVLSIGIGMSLLLDDYVGRRLLSSAVPTFQFLHLASLILQRRHQTAGRAQYLIVFAALMVCGTMLYRIAAILIGFDSARSLTDSTPTVIWTFLLVLLSVLLLALGMLMMNQERAEQALADSELRYRRLVESANEGICVVQEGLLRFVNPKGVALFGRPEQALIGLPMIELIHPDDREQVTRNHVLRVQGKADDLRYPVRVLAGPDLRERWFEISGVHIDWHGRPAGLNFFTDITERRELDEQIRTLAYHDSLTGLPNRRLLVEHLQLAMARSQRNGQGGAVIFMDLDNFKPLNDRHGHHVGDQLLVEVARRLRHGVRRSDTVARFGGDEFVVLLGELNADAAQSRELALRLAGKMIEILSTPYELPCPDGASPIVHRCTASAGIAMFAGLGIDADALLDRADSAMYQAKEDGRNRVRSFDEET